MSIFVAYNDSRILATAAQNAAAHREQQQAIAQQQRDQELSQHQYEFDQNSAFQQAQAQQQAQQHAELNARLLEQAQIASDRSRYSTDQNNTAKKEIAGGHDQTELEKTGQTNQSHEKIAGQSSEDRAAALSQNDAHFKQQMDRMQQSADALADYRRQSLDLQDRSLQERQAGRETQESWQRTHAAMLVLNEQAKAELDRAGMALTAVMQNDTDKSRQQRAWENYRAASESYKSVADQLANHADPNVPRAANLNAHANTAPASTTGQPSVGQPTSIFSQSAGSGAAPTSRPAVDASATQPAQPPPQVQRGGKTWVFTGRFDHEGKPLYQSQP